MTNLAEYQNKHGPLTGAEVKLVEAIKNRDVAEIHPNGLPPKISESRLRAKFLRALILSELSDSKPDNKGIAVRGAWISGELDLEGCAIDFALRFYSCVFDGQIILWDSQTKNFQLSGSLIEGIGKDGSSIAADRVHVRGSFFARDGFQTKGELRFLGSNIDGNLELDGAIIRSSTGYAVDGCGMTTRGHVYLRNGFTAHGAVSFLDANIIGSLSCIGGQFLGVNESCLILSRIEIGNTLFLRDQRIDDADFKRPLKTCIAGTLDLRDATVDKYEDATSSWPNEGMLRIDGFCYNTISSLSTEPAEDRKKWLQLQPRENLAEILNNQPFEQLIHVFNKIGLPSESRKIGVYKHESMRRAGTVPFIMLPFYLLFGAITGYGYYPWRAIWFVLFFWLMGALVFQLAFLEGDMVPNNAFILRSKVWSECASKWESRKVNIPTSVRACWRSNPEGFDFPRFSAAVYSLDVFVPFISLHQEVNWIPKPKYASSIVGQWSLAYFWAHIFVGYLISAILVAAIAGLVRK